ncbi:restriction endonuclease subunit S [Actinotalea sp. K2]|uniref:restriction endonuclease subunit S n=1 Tax=Actinotalea sp. K2 TaxID=2939438 RepID=UPI002016E777|nr:restriction endonuclease subunit S [Actinotalea sp. K2]MCL3861738.1 restriction endonuclease subunit S [Actinotalea sp. K2]
MFIDLKPYDAYSPLGRSGLVEAPRGWKVKPMRTILRPRSERNGSDLPLLSVARERGVFVRTAGDDNHNAIPEDLTNYKVARAGDLVINKMKAWQGSLGLAPCDGLVSPAYFVYGVDFDDRYYLQALLRSRRYVDLFAAASDGVRIGQWDLSINRFRGLPVLIPSSDEQAAIVKYLSYAHHRIDRAIAAKRKLIALLDEQKKSIINHAVTRGLDPTVPLQDSGVPSLGHIPEAWSLTTVGRLQVLVTSGSRGWSEHYSDTGPLFIQSGNLGRDISLNFARTQRVDLPPAAEGVRTAVREDDVLVCITGALTGNVVHVRGALGEPAYVNQHVALIRLHPHVAHARFVAYVMHSVSGQQQFGAAEYGGTKQGLGLADVKRVAIPMPSLDEQHAIVAHIDRETGTVGAAIYRCRREIDLLREFRTRLSSDVVTGQFDVRQIAAMLPDLDPTELAADVGTTEDDLVDETSGLLEDVDA